MSAVIRLCAEVVRSVCDEDGPDAESMRELVMAAKREHDVAIAERDRLRERVRDLEERVEMSCESPPPGCDCPGCALARATWGES